MARSRASAREWGKSDAIDALAIARALLREPGLPEAHHDPATWELRLLVDRRDDVVLQRVAVINRLLARLHQIDPARPQPKKLHRRRPQNLLDGYLAGQSGLMAELGRQELADIARFTDIIDELTARITAKVQALGSTLPGLPGCAELTAAKLIAETGDVTRFRSEAAFARYVGIAPVPMWSGSTRGRLRSSRAGNRQLNGALHRVAVVQLAMPASAGRAYFDRRRAEGDSGTTALRCLKRRICRLIYTRLRADQARREST
jgi:transposase